MVGGSLLQGLVGFARYHLFADPQFEFFPIDWGQFAEIGAERDCIVDVDMLDFFLRLGGVPMQ